MTDSFWQFERTATPSVALPEAVDVAIIGAGILGASVAYHLRRQAPSVRVAVLDRTGPAAGASGRNAGFILLGTADHYAEDVARMGREAALALWRRSDENRVELLQAVQSAGIACAWTACGRLGIAESEAEWATIQQSAELLRADGFADVDVRDGRYLRRQLGSAFDDAPGALWVGGDAGVHSGDLVRGLLASSGAAVVYPAEIERLEPVAGGVIVRSKRGNLRAGRVVIAANAWLPGLVPTLTDEVRPVRGQVLVTAPLGYRVLDPVVYADGGYQYFRQLPDTRFLMGGCRLLDEPGEIGLGDQLNPTVQAGLETYLHRRFPQTVGLAVTHRWSGPMAFTSDGLPRVGQVPDVPGAIYAGGFTGHGFGFAFRLGRDLAESVAT